MLNQPTSKFQHLSYITNDKKYICTWVSHLWGHVGLPPEVYSHLHAKKPAGRDCFHTDSGYLQCLSSFFSSPQLSLWFTGVEQKLWAESRLDFIPVHVSSPITMWLLRLLCLSGGRECSHVYKAYRKGLSIQLYRKSMMNVMKKDLYFLILSL